MKNRLQFRYHTDIFFNRELAYEYLHETINNQYDARSFSSLIAEPLVSYYYDEKGNVVPLFMIGMGGNGSQPVNENVNYFIIDAAKIEEDIKSLQEVTKMHDEKLLELEKALQAEIERATKKEQELESAINKLIKNLESEIAARRAVDGQMGPQYIPNKGTTAEPIYFIDDATSLNNADMKLDAAIKMVENKSLTNINVNGLNGSVKENVASVVVGGKDIHLTDYKKATKSHPVTSTDTINEAFGKAQMQIDTIQEGVGLNSDGTYNKNITATYINDAENVHNATEILDEVITNLYGGEPVKGMETIHKIGHVIESEISNRVEKDEELSEMINKNSADIATINTYSVNHKLIKNNPIINGGDIPLDNYIASAGVSNIIPSDSVNIALGKLETRAKNVQSNLDAEVNRATKVEDELSNNINVISGHVVTLQSDMDVAEKNIINIKHDLANEIERATDEETRLESKIDANINDISNLENELSVLSGVVAANKIVNKDGSVNLVSTDNGTDLSVRVKNGDNALILGVDGLYVDVKAYTDYKGENAIVISDRDNSNMRTVSLKVNAYDNVLTNDGAGLKVNLNMEYDAEAKRIYLLGKDINGKSVVLSEINTSDFVKDGMIKEVSYNKNSGVLTIVWNADSTVTGEEMKTEIDLSNLISVYLPGNGLRLDENNKFHVVVDEEGCDKINGVPVLSSTEKGVKVIGVSAAITELLNKTSLNSDLISAEAKRAKDAENALTLTIQTETSRALGVETQLQNNIDGETTARENAVSILTTNVNAVSGEVATLKTKVDTNADLIKDETNRAESAESELQNSIESETTARENAVSILTTNVNAVSTEVATLKTNVDANTKAIADEVKRAESTEAELVNSINDNKISINTLNDDFTKPGSVRHYIVESMIANVVTPIAGEALDQTLLRRVQGENTFYASNNTNDMKHNGDNLSTVIDDLISDVETHTNEIASLKERVNELEKFKIDAEHRIEELESKLESYNSDFEQRVKNIISGTLRGTQTEIKVTPIYATNTDGIKTIDEVQIGFADDAIFNSSL